MTTRGILTGGREVNKVTQADRNVAMRGQPAIRPEALIAISCDPSCMHYFDAAGDAISR